MIDIVIVYVCVYFVFKLKKIYYIMIKFDLLEKLMVWILDLFDNIVENYLE